MESSELTAEEEMLTIRDLIDSSESQTKVGDSFYIITLRWWQEWLHYVHQNMSSIRNNESSMDIDDYELDGSTLSKRPSYIDNSDLVDDMTCEEDSEIGAELHDNLMEGHDYILLPEEVWKQLYTWYGGGPTLTRKAINSGSTQKNLHVEVYSLRLHLILMPKGEQALIRISKQETVGDLRRRACDIFDLTPEQMHIWNYYGHKKHAMMTDMDTTLSDADVKMDQEILLEMHTSDVDCSGCLSSIQKNGSSGKESATILVDTCRSDIVIDGGFSTNKGASRGCSSDFPQNHLLPSPASEADGPDGTNGVVRGSSGGLIGLLNLGNTCFMNSAIQCLVHTPEFARYFRENYHQEINWQNPLGMVGELAMAFGELLRKLWSPGRAAVSPRPFKTKLARFAPQFSGYNQHDSQELLAFLLDGLHEDLNRVKVRPYIKPKDADGRPDEEVADEYWANHIARNDSIIVDVCQGQYKSTLVCPVCRKVSITFDPFMYLSLPLPSTKTRLMTLMIFSSDGTALPTPCTVTVPKHGKCRDLIQAVSSACSLNAGEKLLLAEVRSHLIHRFFDDPLISLSTIKDDDYLVAYRLPKLAKPSIFLQLIHRQQDVEPNNAQSKTVWTPYGTPLVVPVIQDVNTRRDIQRIVQLTLSPMRRIDASQPMVPNVPADNVSEDRDVRDASSSEIDPNLKVVSSHKLPLQLVDENNVCVDLTVGEDKFVKLPTSSSSVLVFIDWSEKDLEKYDIHYLESLPEVFKYGTVNKKLQTEARTESLSLYTCLEAFLREEPLVPEDMWFCPQCKERRQACKKLDLWRLPEVLVIHLKRFSYSRSMKHKLENFVNFPIHDLDLTNYVANKNCGRRQLYELYALSNHYGSMGSGHYTAHIKILEENRWYNFDDNHISPITEEEVKSAAAYVLFYRRVKAETVCTSNGGQSCARQTNILQ